MNTNKIDTLLVSKKVRRTLTLAVVSGCSTTKINKKSTKSLLSLTQLKLEQSLVHFYSIPVNKPRQPGLILHT